MRCDPFLPPPVFVRVSTCVRWETYVEAELAVVAAELDGGGEGGGGEEEGGGADDGSLRENRDEGTKKEASTRLAGRKEGKSDK